MSSTGSMETKRRQPSKLYGRSDAHEETDTESDVPSFRGLQECPIQGTTYGLTNGSNNHFDGNGYLEQINPPQVRGLCAEDS